MSSSDEHKSTSSSSSSSSSEHHHHHHHHRKHRMDDSDRFKRAGLSSIKRRKIMGQILFWLMILAAMAVIFALVYVYAYTPAVHYK